MKLEDLIEEYEKSEALSRGRPHQYEHGKFMLLNSVCRYIIDKEPFDRELEFINRLQRSVNHLRENEKECGITAILQKIIDAMKDAYGEATE